MLLFRALTVECWFFDEIAIQILEQAHGVFGAWNIQDWLNNQRARAEVELRLHFFHCLLGQVEMAELSVELFDVVFAFFKVQKVKAADMAGRRDHLLLKNLKIN